MQNFIKLFHTVQEIGPVSLFSQYLDLGKALTNDKWHLENSLGLDLVNIIVYAKFYQNIPPGHGSSIGSKCAWHASGPEFDPHVQHILSW